MTDAPLSKSDLKRGRNLLYLTAAALISVTAALGVVATQGITSQVVVMDEKMFPGLAEASGNAASIRIDAPGVKVTLDKGADGKWTVAERGHYPANPDGVRALVLSLADLTLIEKRTADPARQPELELTTGEKGLGHAITIAAADGTVLAALVAGKVQTPAAGNTPGTLFVRRPNEDQVWLARGGLAVPASVGATLDQVLVRIDRARIDTIKIALDKQPVYTLNRPSPDVADYRMGAVPDGKDTVDATLLAAPATALAGLTFEDVVKAADVKIDKVSTATFTTFDGLVITLQMVPGASDAEKYALISASVDEAKAAAAPPPKDGAKPDVKAEAAAINAKLAGWAYKLPAYVTGNLMPPLDTLVKDKAAPASDAPLASPAPGTPPTPAPDDEAPDTDEDAPPAPP